MNVTNLQLQLSSASLELGLVTTIRWARLYEDGVVMGCESQRKLSRHPILTYFYDFGELDS